MKLAPEELTRTISTNDLDFASTRELSEFRHILGQPRASESLEFGLGIPHPGYNLYVAGESGMGRTRYLRDYLKPLAARGRSPRDWLYVNNFENPREPRCLSMPHQQGMKLVRDVDIFIEALLATYPTVFENPAYVQQKTALQREFEDIYDRAFSVVEAAATERGIAVFRDEGAITFSLIVDGHIADEADFAQLSDKDRDEFRKRVIELEAMTNEALFELPAWQRQLNNRLRELRQQVIRQSLKPLVEDLQKLYQGNAGVLIYIAQISKHLPRVIEEHFSEVSESQKEQPVNRRKILEKQYRPNLLTGIGGGTSSPIVLENNPSAANLFGRITVLTTHGDVVTDFQQIAPGALHRANEGYLIMDIEKILVDPEAWEGLKRTLREGRIAIESRSSEAATLKPEPIPLQVKVILIGPREIYHALSDVDHDFYELFRVLVDFDSEFDCTADNLNQFAALLHTRAREAGIAELTAGAIARLAVYGCRLAESQAKLTTHIEQIMDLVIEADFLRSKGGGELTEARHIELAIEAKIARHARLQQSVHEEILSGRVRIATSGSVVGQVNGLSIIQNGETSFGCPLRITATAHPGSRGVVDIEREVKLGQAVHSKGVLLLSGFLCGRYARNFSLGISAHIAIEQSYGYIDGDSASLAELCALLSTLASAPIRQDLAMTGSVSQFGEVQAIGGVNQKIEGFFDICAARGLTGSQGVIIPESNRANLMLAERVVEAVRSGTFAIHAISSVDEAMALLTGMEIGEEQAEGFLPEDSLNNRIVRQLKRYSLCSAEGRGAK
jgi:predicted ATP-dependent protease